MSDISDLSAAYNELRRNAMAMRGQMALMDKFKDVAALQQAADQAQAKIDELHEVHARDSANIAQEHAKAKDQADAYCEKKRIEGEEHLASAQKVAAKVVADAKITANSAIDTAQKRIDKLHAEVNLLVDQREEHAHDIADAQLKLDNLKAALAETLKQHAAAQARYGEFLASIGAKA